MNGKGCHDADISVLKSDSPFAWQQHSLPTPSPFWNCNMLVFSCRCDSRGKGLCTQALTHLKQTHGPRSCHSTAWCYSCALFSLQSVAELPHFGKRYILIITTFPLIRNMFKWMKADCLIILFYFFGVMLCKKAFGYTVNSLTWLVPNHEILPCLIYYFFYMESDRS